MSMSRMSVRETLTDTSMWGKPMRSHRRISEQACSHTYWSSLVMKPLRSKRGMNSDGGWSPHSGWFQRTSASAPERLPSAMRNLGCR